MQKAILAILLAGPLLAESPQFEVASVRPFAPAQGQVAAGLHFDVSFRQACVTAVISNC